MKAAPNEDNNCYVPVGLVVELRYEQMVLCSGFSMRCRTRGLCVAVAGEEEAMSEVLADPLLQGRGSGSCDLN